MRASGLIAERKCKDKRERRRAPPKKKERQETLRESKEKTKFRRQYIIPTRYYKLLLNNI